ncbi:PDDEXK-like family protein [Methylobacter psychrophilus]|uniref:PDDEXK-like family protein n=1 Tax=Methylobacter psychrophilus TaxID=96941 RepID=UPI0021D4B361|nr:PD-(D/E)XK nuclease family protein [Methylobacter psychrophilus]
MNEKMDVDESFDDLSIDQIRNEIIKFKNDIGSQRLDNYYSTKSYSEILGVSRRELSHSNFIAWLLNDQESHDLSSYPIKKFLEILVISSKNSQSQKHKELFDAIITGDLSINSLKIFTEMSIKDVGRIDIFIELNISFSGKQQKLRIIVENKVTSKEHSDQTVRYFDYFESLEDKTWNNLYIYLTPLSGIELSELSEPECLCKEYIQTNYQNLVDYLLEPILNKNISRKTENIIKEYLQALSQPTQNNEDEEHRQGLIMAIGNEERDLLTKFWDKNQKLILSALYAISSDPDQEKDIRDNISSALKSISSNQKDRSLLSIFYNGELQVDKIKKSDLGYSTVHLLDEKNLIDQEMFSFLSNDRSCSFQLLKLKEEMTQTEIRYSKYRPNTEPELIFDNKGYYVARNWGVGNIQNFIKKVTKKIPLLSYEVHE